MSILKDALESGPSTEGQATSEIVLSGEEANSNLAQMAKPTAEVQPLLHLSDQKDNLILEQTSDETPIVSESGLGPSNSLLHSYNKSEMQVMQAYDSKYNKVHPEVEIKESVVETEIGDPVVQDEDLDLKKLITEINDLVGEDEELDLKNLMTEINDLVGQDEVRDVTCQVSASFSI